MNVLTVISGLNWMAIAAATVASSVLGGVWFTVLFGKAYAAALGRQHDPQAKPAPNPNMPRPLFYGLISGSYFLLSGLLVSVILVAL